ncbi:MAG: 5-oxoprolinase [Enterovirga sp.]|nr:5-oxoprolinase [Enterovirga sp.]
MQMDPITLEIIASRFEEIQQIMKQRLFRTGYSTILRESFDGSSGLTTADGRLIGASGVSYHTVPYSMMVKWIVAHFGLDDIHPGDTFLSNDPYKGCVAHTPDVAVVTPVFADGVLVAFCTSMGHKPDVGGIAPSTSSALSRSIFHEGLVVPPVKLYARGVPNEGVQRILANNSRTPELLMGDIEGQVGCTRIGRQLMEELCARYSVPVVQAAMELLLDSAETRLRLALAAVPDGDASAENWLDGDGASDRPVKVHVTVRKRGDTLSLDLTGSDPQTLGPANAVEQACRAAATGAVLGFLDPGIPFNDGVFRAIEIDTGEGLCVSPRFPSPVNSYIPTTHILFNCVAQALGQLCPERAFADSGLGCGGFGFGYAQPGGGPTRVQYEVIETALGGTSRGDGAPMVFTVMIFESVEPIEIVETEFPVRIDDFSVRTDSGGAGIHRGGLGYCRSWRVLQDAQFSSRTSHRRFGASGIAGGGAPLPSRTTLNPGRPDERVLNGLEQLNLKAGDVIRLEQSGGGGWGDPKDRDGQALLDDVADGYVSEESARRAYGRAVTREPSGRVAFLRE